jgi:hypothetical protein
MQTFLKTHQFIRHIHCYLTSHSTPGQTPQFYSDQATYWTIEETGFDFDQEQVIYSLLHSLQKDCGVYPAPYKMGTGGHIPGE